MTTNKPEVVAVMYRDGGVLTKQECGIAFDMCCKVETPLIRLSDYEALEIAKHPAESERLRTLVAECVDYLNHSEHTCIHNGSALHRKLTAAAMQEAST